MPSNCCCVPGCHERGGHVFPSNITRRKELIVAIKRLDEEDKTKLWQPSKSAVVCKKHFTADDYVTDTIKGNAPFLWRLKTTAVPSIFTWKKDPDTALERTNRANKREERKRKFAEICTEELEARFYEEVDVGEVTVPVEEQKEQEVHGEESHSKIMKMVDAMNQTITQPIYSLEQFQNDPSAIHFYSGLESFAFIGTSSILSDLYLFPSSGCLH